MNFILIFFVLLMSLVNVNAGSLDDIYYKTFGDSKKQAIIYVHGGPGHNSRDFEVTTAQVLADKGFFVVVYDQRGQGRSKEAEPSDFNYKQYADDIKSLMEVLRIENPILIGHSHGGPIVMNFDRLYPGVARKIVLVSVPLDMSGMINALLENSARKYAEKNDQKNLEDVSNAKRNLSSYASLTGEQKISLVVNIFGHGVNSGLYVTSQPTEEEKRHWSVLLNSSVPKVTRLDVKSMPGFLINEDHIHKNFVKYAEEHRERLCGIYGNEDGLFTPLSLGVIQLNVGSENFKLIKGASHALYIHQQTEFLNALKITCKLWND